MAQPDERDLRIQELEERLSRLSSASLRITEDLDFNTVLQGVLDSARFLTGARYGAITLVDDSLGLQDVFFPGVSEQEARQPACPTCSASSQGRSSTRGKQLS